MAPKGLKRTAGEARSASASSHSWLSEKVPKVLKTGNQECDSELMRDRACFQDIIDSCLEDKANIACAYAAIQQRKTRVLDLAVQDQGSLFDKISQVDRLPANWIMQWITNHSDLTMPDLVTVFKQDPDAPLHIFLHFTELPAALRLPKQCGVKAVMYNIARDRATALGRSMTFKGSGAVCVDGKLNWKDHGNYKLVFGESPICTSIVHVSSNKAITPPAGVQITKQWFLRANFSDHSAFVECSPIPPIKLAKFFSDAGMETSSQGPFKYPVFCGGSCKPFNERVALAFQQWEADELKKSLGDKEDEQISQFKSDKKKEHLTKARAKAADLLKVLQDKRKIALG
jgi:hypothetical protein